jgi:LPS export ABC transporter protein LptC
MRPAPQRTRQLNQRLVALAACVAAVALLYRLFGALDDSDVERGPATPARGYFATDTTLTEMGATGHPRYVVHARRIEQQLSDQSVLLSDIWLDYLTKDQGTWHVTALNGRMPEDRKSLLLSGDVTITGAADRGGAIIRTDQVNYGFDDGIVQTAEPVTVRLGAHEINARGLRAMLNAGTLRLESNVHGRFIP